MITHWGVDSFTPADVPVRIPSSHAGGGSSRATMQLFEYVTHRFERPTFWGRYLNTTQARAQRRRERAEIRRGGYPSHLTRDEADFLHSQNCKILLVYNQPNRRQGGYRIGRSAAVAAANMARDLGVSDGVRLYADLEAWQIQADWFRGWIDGLNDSPYRAGAYGRPVTVIENPEVVPRMYGADYRRRSSRFSPDARRQAAEAFAADPGRHRVVVNQRWGDDMCDALDGYHDELTATPEGRMMAGAVDLIDFHIWSNMPRRVIRSRARDDALGPHSIVDEFAAESAGCGHSRAVVWQYVQNCLWPPERRGEVAREVQGYVDLCLAAGLGLSHMW